MEKCNSNKGTGGMECSVVLFKPRIHLFACTHPSVSNSCDCNALFQYKHQSVALIQTCLVGGSLFVYKHRFQTRLNGDSLFVYKHLSPALCFKHVWIVVPCLSTCISLQPCVSNTFDVRFLVCVHASVNSPLFQTRLIVVACLFTSISLEPKWLRHESDGDPTHSERSGVSSFSIFTLPPIPK